MHLEVGKKYRTYGGDTVEVLYICETPLMEAGAVIGVKTYAGSGNEVIYECSIEGVWINEENPLHSIKEEL